jgi:AraC-like DNA-binding protein
MSDVARIVVRAGYRLELGTSVERARAPVVALDPTALLLLEGDCSVSVGGTRHDLAAPAVALANEGAGVGVVAASRGLRLLVALRPALVRSVLAGGEPIFFAHPTARSSEIVDLDARRITAELTQGERGADANALRALDLAVELLALDLVSEYAAPLRAPRLEQSRAGFVDRRLRRSIELMRDNYARDLPLGEIAAAAYMSEFHFARLFKRLTGHTPHAYLAGLRIEHAGRLLAETDLSIGEIAGRVGYQSGSHFGRVFRAATGLTPSAYRDALVR